MLITGGLLLNLDSGTVTEADVRIAGTRIVEVGSQLPLKPHEVRLDITGRWLMPGLCLAHHHLYSALACGMPMPVTTPASFTEMLKGVWWKLDRALDLPSVETSALVGGLQALRAGVTTIFDHHASPTCINGSLEAVSKGLTRLGMRHVLCYEVSDRGGEAESLAGLEEHYSMLDKQSPMRGVMIGAHANFTLSDKSLARCASLAQEAGVALHIHVAEAVDDARATGEALIGRMERLGALLPGSIFAHCVHLSRTELQHLDELGIWVSHQPRSNQNNSVGYPKLESFPDTTVLGTDGIGGDLFAELQAGWFRAQDEGVPWSPQRWLEVLHQGSALASQKLGVSLGGIRPGFEADLVVLDPIPGPPLSDANLAASFLFRLTSSAVRDVMVAGRWRLQNRMPCGIDTAALQQRAAADAQAVWSRMRD